MAILVQVWIDHWVSRKLRLLEFLDNRHMKMAKLSALCTDRLYPQADTHGTHYARGSVGIRAIVRLEGLSQRKIPVIHSRIKSATFQLVTQCYLRLL
jgi:hypothetical protein